MEIMEILGSQPKQLRIDLSIAPAQNLILKAYHFLCVDLKDVIEHRAGPFREVLHSILCQF